MVTQEQILQIEDSSLPEALALVATIYPGQVVFSSSLGQEDQVITDVICKNKLDIEIFTLDTGRLFYETYELIERTNARYAKNLKVYFPDAAAVELMVSTKGVNSFYESVENRKECCNLRKVKPLNRALQGAKVWITGLRAAQSDNRKEIKMLEWDPQRALYKFNPLINWSNDEIMAYIKEHNVPYNSLHDKGFTSIGCSPCTRAIERGEDDRAGRWWWETSTKECGLHVKA